MKKVFLTLLWAAVAMLFAATAQNSRTMYIMKNGITTYQVAVSEFDSIIFYAPEIFTTDPGVVINGVKWATRNVDEVGTFAATPESAGKFYQWNRNVAWNATGSVSGWDRTVPTGTSWTRANDPSPAGWRVPTYFEMQSLLDTNKVRSVWTTQNGVNGRRFTDRSNGNSLFLPAVGYRNILYSTLYDAGTQGNYWSNIQSSEEFALRLGFHDIGDAYLHSLERRHGFSVRSVAE